MQARQSSRHAKHNGGGGEGLAPRGWAAGRRISASSPSLPPSSPPATAVEPSGGGASCPVGIVVTLRRLLGRVFVDARAPGAEAAGPFRDDDTASG